MASQLRLMYSLVFIGLFTIAIMGFAINFASDNNSAIDISNDPELSSLDTNTQGNVSAFRQESQSTYTSIINSSIEEGETTPSGGQFAITPFNALAIATNIMKVGYVKIFGTGTGFGIFMTTFIGLLVFTMAFVIWKSWIGRSPVD